MKNQRKEKWERKDWWRTMVSENHGRTMVSNLDLWRAQRRVASSCGWKSRHGKKPEPCSVDGRGWWKRCLLKPIDKVGVRPVSEYPGRNLRERRCSLVKVEIHWSSLSLIGEDRILMPTLANKVGRTVTGYQRRHG